MKLIKYCIYLFFLAGFSPRQYYPGSVGDKNSILKATTIPRIPVITGSWKQIIHKDSLRLPELMSKSQIVDHCFFPAANGSWQGWVQIRGTTTGRVFTRWESQLEFNSGQWKNHGICWNADKGLGESVGTKNGDDIIQAPYVLKEKNRFLLVYGGGPIDTGDRDRQISLAESNDGITFRRRLNKNGFSRIAAGPNHAADAFLMKHQDKYLLYVGTQRYKIPGAEAAVTLRVSEDLINWSEPKVVHAGGVCGTHSHSSQSIFIAELDGFFYLFKMGWSGDNKTDRKSVV